MVPACLGMNVFIFSLSLDCHLAFVVLNTGATGKLGFKHIESLYCIILPSVDYSTKYSH